MTLNDIKKEIVSLGFERDVPTDEALVHAIGRALCTIYSDRAVYSEITVGHYPAYPRLLLARLTHTGGESEEIRLYGKAFSLLLNGQGSLRVESGGETEELKFNTPHYVYSGFINGEATLHFEGELSYTASSIGVFDRLTSDKAEELTLYGEPSVYVMSRLVGDFGACVSLPCDSNGRIIRGSAASGDKVFIPFGYEGEVCITYKRRPPTVSVDIADEELDIPTELSYLVPLLAASYYWLDDDEEKALLYRRYYEDAMADIKRNDIRRFGGGYENVTGWA